MSLDENSKGAYSSAVVKLKDKAREIEVYLQRDTQDSERVRGLCRSFDSLYEEYKRARQSYVGI